MSMAQALTIAGSDNGGGAGIQADLKTFQELGAYGLSVITAVTAQNTLGVQGVYPVPLEGIARQLDSTGEDFQPGAVKTGMLFSAETIRLVSEKWRQFGWTNLVIDPVMVAKGGAPLLQQEAVHALITDLLPHALITTPNIPEAELITGMTIRNLADREEAARRIVHMGSAYALVKGGHAEGNGMIVDVLYDGTSFHYLENVRIVTRHTHGTGCTYSAAITAELAKGSSVLAAVTTARAFIQAAIEDELGIGAGHGPTNHFAYQRRQRGEQ
ncbi:bifunctional hydroxymethylpyrimidine kinase/phosphomethylpyrimidine kinase [Paenibacillus sp. CC-CFT742]|uniref:bifunctional hydroxymethylpyrimidine kinase/phosphomethylpyrimidine kinase n=1 Tax=Paenibacillus illinoisensis TaxID=59845 RepID=UPI00203C11B7|nr:MULTISPECIES: bifunctional hydroxymethylpyrimidine kinase/phosphomethylpyrimidine kinase [Paenibacillus]MCM3204063.1 bifunctional hydroxymethylpyrimidine kinase/phosphomethylpyrimidine kinase [Paenibacillus illinoisensis]WJH31278.1 bifunctional hydroxymethylpyrimidine kinase/phosphomethylpyrimidine kinase [Paenibacillus sp. CC-CFT742]